MIHRAHRRSTLRRALAVAATGLAVAGGLAVAQHADAATGHKPVGSLQWVRRAADAVSVRGWAVDTDTKNPAQVRLKVDGRITTTLTASAASPGVAKKHPQYGDHRAFLTALPLAAGKHTVCAYVVNYPSKTATVLLRCITLTVSYDPVGALQSVKQTPGHLTLSGWTADPSNVKTALFMHVNVDKTPLGDTTANLVSSGALKTFPRAGGGHGFAITVPVPEGTHQLCLRVRNIGLGSAPYVSVACVSRTVNYSPTGSVTKVTMIAGGKLRISGEVSDPDTSAPVSGQLTSSGTVIGTYTTGTDHTFSGIYPLPQSQTGPSTHAICVIATNLGQYGKTRTVACSNKRVNYNPAATLQNAKQHSPGIGINGYAKDPDTTKPIKVRVSLDGTTTTTITADGANKSLAGHGFSALVSAGNGPHQVCVTALNTLAGTGPSPAVCRSMTLNFNPYGAFQSAGRAKGSTDVALTGWAIDPDTTKPIQVKFTVDGKAAKTVTAGVTRADIAKAHPGTGKAHGFSTSLPATDGEHKICATAVNTAGGTANTSLGCRIVIAVHPKPAAAPTAVTAEAGYGGAVVRWTAPADDGGAPWSGYTITSSPGTVKTTATASDTSATVLGLKPKTKYTFTVVANNVAGASAAGASNASTTLAQPPAQTTPAPISTSRYIRNIKSATTSDTQKMYREGQADAAANPSGHGYLVLLDIGGQDETRHGVILSAGVRFVSYSALVTNLKSYVDGYANKQKPSAPITIALGTNNDIDVSKSAGASWANNVVDPVVAYARKYPNVVIAGANDIEPGFTASYSQTKAWLTGYLAATPTPFVFNGSADGCSWSTTGARCNNGWTMSQLFYLAGGAAPTRIINLPQVYNSTMAKQWRYISLTGVVAGQPKLNFGGALTEWTACQQDGGCGSISGNSAWTQLWTQLRADARLNISSLPYSTDLRIDR
jgi:hypothetical protein